MCSAKGSIRSKASARSRVELDELARLHDDGQLSAIFRQHANVLERVAVNDQNIGIVARPNPAEMRLHQDLGIHRRHRPQDGNCGLYFPPNQKLPRLVRVQMAKKIRPETYLKPRAIHDLQALERLLAHLAELLADPGRQAARFG